MQPLRTHQLKRAGKLGAALVALALLLALAYWFSREEADLEIIQSPAYTATTTPVHLGDHSTAIGRASTLLISAKFAVRAGGTDGEEHLTHENLFQTAPANTGIRLEIGFDGSGPQGWALIIGDKNGHFKAFDLGPPPTAGADHDLDIMIGSRSLEVSLDGITIQSASTRIPNFQSNEIIVGQGFSSERRFHGEINAFAIHGRSLIAQLKSAASRYYSSSQTASGSPVETLLKPHLQGLLTTAVALLLALFLAPPGLTKKTAPASGKRLWRSGLLVLAFSAYAAFLIYLKAHYIPFENSAPLYDIALSLALVWIAALLLRTITLPSLRKLYIAFCFTANYLAFLSLIAGVIFLKNTNTTISTAYTGELGAFYQTNIGEIGEFLWVYFNLAERLHILALAFIPALLFWICMTSKAMVYKPRRDGLAALAAVALIYHMPTPAESITGYLVSGYTAYRENTNEFMALMQQRKSSGSINARAAKKGGTYIVVIGESSNRDHYSSYGYFRPTTPFLDQQAGKPDWLFFKRAYASFVHTTPSLLHALTEANQYNGRSYYQATSLIEVANAANFDTYWIDEQGRAIGDNPVNAIAANAKKTKFVPAHGELIRQFEETLRDLDKSKNNLIVLHLAGSHFDYRARLPKGYEVSFNDTEDELGDFAKDKAFLKDLLDPYDTTIHYTDHILDQLQQGAQRYAITPDVFLYFSDHGEDVFGRKFHNAAQFTYPMARIPLILNYSTRWAQQNPKKLEQLKARLDAPFTLDLAFETLLGLMDIEGFPYDKKFDLSADAYGLTLDNAITMKTGKELNRRLYEQAATKALADDPRIIAEENLKYLNSRYPGKVLSVYNDIKSKAFESRALGFQGMEFNVTAPMLVLGHYPEITLFTGLDDFLTWPPIENSSRLWIDVKTMENHDIQESFEKLRDLDIQHHLKGRSILESWDDGLSRFSSAGWQTSYYIHPKNWPNCKNFTANLDECAKLIAERVKATGATSISFFSQNYAFIKQHLEKLLPGDIPYHTFGLPGEINIYNKGLPRLVDRSPIFNDTRVHTILLESSQTFGLKLTP